MTALATRDQVRAIHAAKSRAGLREEEYRGVLAGFGVASSKDLSGADAAAFLDRLNAGRGPLQRPSSRRATGPFAGKLQALWIAGWNLGVVRERDDAAMMALVERQTGLAHTRFLRDPVDAAKAIEAVKAMLVRDGGVQWPKRKGPASIELKRAIVAAQLRRLADSGLYPEGGAFERLDPAGLDALSKRLGVELRRSLTAEKPHGA